MATKKVVKTPEPEEEEIVEEPLADGRPIDQYQLKMLLYGMPGAGKTTLAASGCLDPRLSPGLMIDFEGGDIAIMSHIVRVTMDELRDESFIPPDDKLCVIRINTWSDFQDVYTVLLDEPELFKTVILDSLSEMNYLCLQTAMKPESQTQRLAARDIFALEAPEQRQYLLSNTTVKKLVRVFRDLPMHTIFVCGTQELQNPKTKVMQRMPAMTGKLAFEIPGLVNIVGYLDTEDYIDTESTGGEVATIRVLDVTPSDKWACKDRSEGGKLGGFVENPTLPHILDLLTRPDNS